ncbi:hypothetical protein CRUP_032338 [Coryphaenoides rupestris]|nr:hypothetical protein CRUP_032338 [Coryphaenoides rupestris]
MKIVLYCAAVALLCWSVESNESPPKVQVYSRDPAMFEKENTINCLVTGFHPPEITIEVMSGGAVLPDAHQTDLAFNNKWQFHLSRHAPFSPVAGGNYSCRVTHRGRVQLYGFGE